MKKLFFLLIMISHISYTTIMLDGKVTSKKLITKLSHKIATFKSTYNHTPTLAILLVGNNPASEQYVSNKKKQCENIGIDCQLYRFDNTVTLNEIKQCITQLNNDDTVDGIIIQLPLPSHLDAETLIKLVDPVKDVDGLHPYNMGSLKYKKPHLIPATPYGIIKLLKEYDIETQGKNCVVIGGGNVAGYPISVLLSREESLGKNKKCECKCTVTLCHQYTTNLSEITKTADIIISAVGKPQLITQDMIKEGAIIIDVGITRVENPQKKSGFEFQGDVDFATVKEKCFAITPVPGGVGPMTVAALLINTYKAARNRRLFNPS